MHFFFGWSRSVSLQIQCPERRRRASPVEQPGGTKKPKRWNESISWTCTRGSSAVLGWPLWEHSSWVLKIRNDHTNIAKSLLQVPSGLCCAEGSYSRMFGSVICFRCCSLILLFPALWNRQSCRPFTPPTPNIHSQSCEGQTVRHMSVCHE